MLHLDHLSLTQDGFTVSANWHLPAGSRLALLGPSGAGKSTLLMGLAGFVAPSAGRILWQGRDLAALTPAQRPVSILFQDQNLFPHLSVAQNLGLAINPRLRLNASDLARVESVLDRLGLQGLGARKPANLSGGQLGRAALGRVLLQARPLLLLDEPFAGVDPIAVLDIQKIIRFLRERGIGVLITDHNVRETLGICDRAYIINDGTLLAAGNPAELVNDESVRRVYLGENFRL